LLFKYYDPVFEFRNDPVLGRDPVLKERARLPVQEKMQLTPFLLVDDPSEISGYRIALGDGFVYYTPRLRGDPCLDIEDVAHHGKGRFASVLVECKREFGPKARAALERTATDWNDWALAADVVRSPAEMTFAHRSVEMVFPQLLERREDALASFVVLMNMITTEISGKTIFF
jgi:hypothetical protein